MTVIHGRAALIGESFSRIENASITMHAGSIQSIDQDSASLDDGGRGITLIPGFIDSHVHIGFFTPRSVLAGGVTTVRDLAWPPDVIFPLAELSRAPDFDGPLILAAGPMLTVAGGYPTRAAWAPNGTARVVGSRDDAMAAVGEVARMGATIVKVALNAEVGPTLDLDLLTVIVSAAHQIGLKVTGHVYGLDELHKALDAGMDELAHMLMSNETIPDGTIERMVELGMGVVPTLSVRNGGNRRTAIDNLRRYAEAGGTILYGTDLGNEGPRPGIDEREIRAMVEAGLSGTQILASGTTGAARWLGLEAAGALDIGRRADIIGVEGDPLADPMALTRVRLVVRAGRVVIGTKER